MVETKRLEQVRENDHKPRKGLRTDGLGVKLRSKSARP